MKLRQIGVEPDDFPGFTERNDLVTLFKKKYEEKSQENREIKRQKELMKMSLPVRNFYSIFLKFNLIMLFPLFLGKTKISC